MAKKQKGGKNKGPAPSADVRSPSPVPPSPSNKRSKARGPSLAPSAASPRGTSPLPDSTPARARGKSTVRRSRSREAPRSQSPLPEHVPERMPRKSTVAREPRMSQAQPPPSPPPRGRSPVPEPGKRARVPTKKGTRGESVPPVAEAPVEQKKGKNKKGAKVVQISPVTSPERRDMSPAVRSPRQSDPPTSPPPHRGKKSAKSPLPAARPDGKKDLQAYAEENGHLVKELEDIVKYITEREKPTSELVKFVKQLENDRKRRARGDLALMPQAGAPAPEARGKVVDGGEGKRNKRIQELEAEVETLNGELTRAKTLLSSQKAQIIQLKQASRRATAVHKGGQSDDEGSDKEQDKRRHSRDVGHADPHHDQHTIDELKDLVVKKDTTIATLRQKLWKKDEAIQKLEEKLKEAEGGHGGKMKTSQLNDTNGHRGRHHSVRPGSAMSTLSAEGDEDEANADEETRLKKQLVKKDTQIAKLKNSLWKKDEHAQKLDEEIAQLRGDLDVTKNKLKDAYKQMERVQRNARKQTVAMQEENARVLAEAATQGHEYTRGDDGDGGEGPTDDGGPRVQTESDLAALGFSVEQYAAAIEELTARVEELQQENQALAQSNHVAATAMLSATNEPSSFSQQRMDALKREIVGLRTRNEALEREVAQLQSDVTMSVNRSYGSTNTVANDSAHLENVRQMWNRPLGEELGDDHSGSVVTAHKVEAGKLALKLKNKSLEVESLMGLLREAKFNLSQEQGKVAELDQMLAQVNSELFEANKELHKQKVFIQANAARFDVLQEKEVRLEELRNDVKRLEAEKWQAVTAFEKAKNEIEYLRRGEVDLKNRVMSQETELDSLRRKLHKLSVTKARMEDTMEQLQDEMLFKHRDFAARSGAAGDDQAISSIENYLYGPTKKGAGKRVPAPPDAPGPGRALGPRAGGRPKVGRKPKSEGDEKPRFRFT